MQRRKRRKTKGLLKKLYELHEGKCTRCGVETILVHEVERRRGWKVNPQNGVVVSPHGEKIPIATVEHIHPHSQGGEDTLENTTLFCEACNRETCVLHDPGYKQKTGKKRYVMW